MMSLSLKNRVSCAFTGRMRARCWRVLGAALWLVSMSVAAAPIDIIVLLDNSGSMRQNDPAFLLKGAVTNFFAKLPADARAGVVIFDQKVSYPVPLAPVDAAAQNAVKESLTKVDYRGQYTNFPAGMERAIYELKTAGRKDATKVVVFMTDGVVDTGSAAVDAEKTKWLREELATDAADNGIRIFGIAFTENADFFLIQSLSNKTSGEYFRALKPEDLDGVFAKVQDQLRGVGASAPAAIAPPITSSEPAGLAPESPAVPAATVAADCLASMPADDRAAIEEMAQAAETTAEALCLEMQNTPAGQPVVTPAPSPAVASSEPAVSEPPPADATTGVALVAGSALILLIAAGVLMFILIKRRKAVPVDAAPSRVTGTTAVSTPPRVPEAYINDINGLTKEPAMQLSAKPMIIGRIAGTDQEHVDYFVVEQPTVGRRHALIRYRDFCFWLSDQGSVNGTFLNGERIEGERQLKHGDRVRLHKYEFEFSMPEMDHAGHTVFADPMNRTMVGDLDTMVATAAVAAGTGLAAGAIARAAAVDDDDDESVFDMSGDADASASSSDSDKTAFLSPRDALPAAAHPDDTAGDGDAEFISLGDDGVDEAAEETQLPVNLRSGILSGTRARADAEFDAEASAFFDEDDLAVTASPYTNAAIERGPVLRLDDDGDEQGDGDQDTMQIPAAQLTAGAPRPVDEFSEWETMLPVSPSVANQTQGVDISLDSFMNTDSFDEPMGKGDFEEDDVTLLPHQVPDIDDVFDVTAEGTIPPVSPRRDDDDEDENDRTTILK